MKLAGHNATQHGLSSRFYKLRLAAVFRWLHLYLSMLGFTALLFFAWTGITLNHPEWFGATQARIRELDGELKTDNIQSDSSRLEVVELLREKHSLRGRVASFENDERELSIVFKGPGYLADVLIVADSGQYRVTESSYGITGILNDLHKGRDTVASWSLLIDTAALVMIGFSLTGFGLVFFLKRRRVRGVTFALIGTIVLFAFCCWAAI